MIIFVALCLILRIKHDNFCSIVFDFKPVFEIKQIGAMKLDKNINS
jgi:hypothetical protein